MKNTAFYGVVAIAIIALVWITLNARDKTEAHNGPISTKNAPQPIGPYSQAVMRGNALFVSGQVAIVPATGVADTADISAETRRVMENIKAIPQVRIYLTDLGNFKTVNEIYGSYFGDGPYPARETVEVSALPKGMHVEISCTAIR
jgi:2-iminobutanoate/2-iminopropanoate deaminase